MTGMIQTLFLMLLIQLTILKILCLTTAILMLAIRTVQRRAARDKAEKPSSSEERGQP